eukprot:scaffold18974_cov132-Skeletonema_marinoi.AAC.6
MGNTTLQLQSSNMPLGRLVSPRIFRCEWELCEASDAGGYLSEEISFKLTHIGFGWERWCNPVQSPVSILDADKLHVDPPQQSQRETKGGRYLVATCTPHNISSKAAQSPLPCRFKDIQQMVDSKQTHLQCINEQSALTEDDGIIDGDCQVQIDMRFSTSNTEE